VGNAPFGIAVDPSEKFVYAANSVDNTVSVLSINSSTGALTLAGTFATGTQPRSVAALGTFLYVANSGSSNISVFSVDANTGALTQITDSPFSASSSPLIEVIDPNKKFLYTASQSGNTISALSIDATTGALSTVSQSVTTASAPSSMSVSK
jgi:6-phosphogluconolactonase (cycloisomerase 2 family)